MARKATLVLAALTLGLAAPAGAGDGVIEINQARAQAGAINGSLVDDPPGFPVRITQPGSYRLTGNLTVADGNTTAVSIFASNVTIDLGGFSILGPNYVSDEPACSAAGTGFGIVSSGFEFIVVRNGQVRGMGAGGVYGTTSRIEGVIAIHNCGDGLYIGGTGSAVIGSQVRRNRNAGIHLPSGSSVVQNTVSYENMGDGIFVGSATVVLGCVIARNKAYGLLTFSASTGVGQSAFYENVGDASTSANSLGCNLFDGLRLCP